MTDRQKPFRRAPGVGDRDIRRDVDDELQFHVETLTEKYTRAGHAPEEARAMAIKEFGDRRRAEEACVDIDAARERRASRREWVSAFRQDLRYGVRRLLGTPAFSAIAVVTLAIGIGPNIAIFNLINGVVLKPLPFADPDRLYAVNETFPLSGGQNGTGSVSYPNYVDWKTQSTTLDFGISTFAQSANLTDAGDPERLSVAQIGADLLPVLGVQPIAGRAFVPADNVPDAPAVAVLSETFWQRRFGGDRRAIGRVIDLDGVPTTIVGVLAAAITVPNRATVVDLWRPLRVKDATANRSSHQYVVVGRLKPGATPAAAAAEMSAIAARLAQLYPQAQEKRSVLLRPYLEWVVGNVGLQLFVLLGAAGLVLLIACANAASLLLARASARRREVAVVAALGASRWRIAQQFLVESLLLAVCGAIVGLALAVAATRAIVAVSGAALPRNTQLDSDWRVVAFIAGAIVLTTLLFGLAPALQSTKTNLQDALRESSRGGAGGRQRSLFRTTLVVTQFALSVVLLAGAGLMLETSAALFGADTGIATADHLLTMRIPFPFGSPAYPTPDAALDRFYYPMLERVRHLPGVAHAGTINLLPLQSYGNNGNFRIDGETYATISDQPFAEYRFVSPGYFETMGVKIVRGRDVSTSDRNGTQAVVLVNQALADRYFKDGDPLTRALVFGQPGPKNPPVPIVGVVSNVRQATLQSSPLPELYFPMGQASGSLANMTLAIDAIGDPEFVRQAVERAIRDVDPTQPVFGVATMTDVMRTSVADKRLYLGLLESFAAMALLLAMAGIYGVISYGVAQRTREFGIRLALGSDTARVQRLVVWQGVRLALIGLAIGVPAASLATRLLDSVLYGVQPGDPATLAAVAGILAVVGVVASYIPARRVARVDPMVAMRAE